MEGEFLFGGWNLPNQLTFEPAVIGAIQKVCHRPRGGGGSSKIVTKSDMGEGVKANSDVTAYQFSRKSFPRKYL